MWFHRKNKNPITSIPHLPHLFLLEHPNPSVAFSNSGDQDGSCSCRFSCEIVLKLASVSAYALVPAKSAESVFARQTSLVQRYPTANPPYHSSMSTTIFTYLHQLFRLEVTESLRVPRNILIPTGEKFILGRMANILFRTRFTTPSSPISSQCNKPVLFLQPLQLTRKVCPKFPKTLPQKAQCPWTGRGHTSGLGTHTNGSSLNNTSPASAFCLAYKPFPLSFEVLTSRPAGMTSPGVGRDIAKDDDVYTEGFKRSFFRRYIK
jgi:hypothetical protein